MKQTVGVLVGDKTVNGIVQGEGLVIQDQKPAGKPEPVAWVQFHLINFLEYCGTPITKVFDKSYEEWLGRVRFSMGEWEVTLDQFQDVDNRIQQAKAIKGNVLTHVGMLRSTDNKLFNPESAEEVLDALYWFFSFMNGAHCAPAILLGGRFTEYPLWQYLEVRHVAPMEYHITWFNENSTAECFCLAQNFYSCWQDPDKKEWLNLALGLYLASNHNSGGIELSLVHTQMLLELLTWVAIQEGNELRTDSVFDRLSATSKIKELSTWLRVPFDIPYGLKFLKAYFPNANASEASVKIRNLIMHPTASNRSHRAHISNDAIHEACQLNLWYAELTLFKLMGYSGHYNNRTGNPHPGICDVTPWTSNL